MFATGLRALSLATELSNRGLSFNEQGVFVGGIPLLTRRSGISARDCWAVRPLNEINDDLTAVYRLPVDVTVKAGALALIASALNHGDLTLALVAAAQMRFPDTPSGSNFEYADEIFRRAVALSSCGLLKADWDPAKHPRTGTKPNPGWFALKPKTPRPPSSDPRSLRWPQPHVNKRTRDFVQEVAKFFDETEFGLLRGVLRGLALDLLIKAFIKTITPVELNQGEALLTAQIKASLQPAKTLEELQQAPAENVDGYERHHIVEQNPGNLEKGNFAKFGSELIDDESNVVWIPHFPHIEVTAEYNSVPNDDGGPILRERINNLDFDQQREIGLSILRKYGVLK